MPPQVASTCAAAAGPPLFLTIVSTLWLAPEVALYPKLDLGFDSWGPAGTGPPNAETEGPRGP